VVSVGGTPKTSLKVLGPEIWEWLTRNAGPMTMESGFTFMLHFTTLYSDKI
jgi:hypothetical protein